MTMKNKIILLVLLLFPLTGSLQIHSQWYQTPTPETSSYTGYAWDNWVVRDCKYAYSNGWVYVYPEFKNPKDFYFRFKREELGIHELSRSEWDRVNQDGGWITEYCTFEYYITDKYQTMKSCLEVCGFPCAKAVVGPGKPFVLQSEKVKTRIWYSKKNKVRTLNFFFSDGSGFGITVHWNYSGYNMKYLY